MRLNDKRMWQRFRMGICDVFYPNRCPCCRRLIPAQEFLCSTCARIVPAAPGRFCAGCGKEPKNCICGSTAYDRAFVVGVYDETDRAGVLSLKTAESLQFGFFIGRQLARMLLDTEFLEADCITIVPPRKKKYAERQQPQCVPPAVIAKQIAMETGLPVRLRLLSHTGKGRPQHELDGTQRRANTGRFRETQSDLHGQHILLVDDVLTTGTTMNECACLLKKMGASSVIALAAASTVLA